MTHSPAYEAYLKKAAEDSVAARAERAARVLAAAVTVAGTVGWAAFTRGQVAAEAGVAAGTVSNAYGDIGALRDAVMAEAVSQGLSGIVAQGLAAGHPTARGAPVEVRQAALATLA